MKKQDLIQLKEAISPLPINTKQHLITWLNDRLQADADSLIETRQPVSCCPHCHSEHIIRWGRASGLQRYCCKSPDCGKTFNSLTGSAMARLQHHEKWFDYLRCMLDSLTLRESAKRTGIDLKTAFRWRHRFLASASAANINPLSGIIEADETFFPESCKGKRHILHREARKRGGQGDKRKERVPVLIARDRLGHVSDHVPEAFNTEYVHRFLAPIIDRESILCSDGAKWYETFASKHDISHHRLITLNNQRVIGRVFHIQNVNSYISRLKGWMSKFHGVGTAYLPNYLAWRRLFETTAVEQARFGSKLTVIYDIDDDISLKIPSLLIQPLVENAIVHGIRPYRGKGVVVIAVKDHGDQIKISVKDTGNGINPETIERVANNEMPGNKIGLLNVHHRVKLLYGEGLQIRRMEPGTEISFYISKNGGKVHA